MRGPRAAAIVPALGARAYAGLGLAAFALGVGAWVVGLLLADALGARVRVGSLVWGPLAAAGAAFARREGVGRALLGAASAVVAVVVGIADAAPLTGISYGVAWRGPTPLPVVDLTIDAHGVARLRPKSHRVAWTELAPLVDGSDVVVIAAGWSRGVVVDRDVAERLGTRLVVLATPDAITRYRALRGAGLRVALVLHSTC